MGPRLTIVAAVLLGACQTGATDGDHGFGGPDLAGLCEDATVDIDAGFAGWDDADQAYASFVEDHGVLGPTRLEDGRIVHDGEVVGSVRLRRTDAGGVYVASAEWCYPE